MRDLFSTAAPVRRDTSKEDAARDRAVKAATTQVFAQAPSALQVLTQKAARLAAEAERDTRERIVKRERVPTVEERRARLPTRIRQETEGALGVSVGSAELLERVVEHWVARREPAVITASGIAANMRCDLDEAHRRVSELQVTGLLLPTTNAVGTAGWRPHPRLLG